jgi:CO/xanthine dehydrogenase Mo-binding subunit
VPVWWRSVGSTQRVFAEVFADELAVAARWDPGAFRLDVEGTAYRAVLEPVAEGQAVHEGWRSAAVAESFHLRPRSPRSGTDGGR